MEQKAMRNRAAASPRSPGLRQAGAMLLVSLLICAVWFSIVCSANIRCDTDRMLYSPGTALNQYQRENRSGLAFLLYLFTANGWDPVLNGALFLLFFLLSCWILWFCLFRFTEGKWKPAWYLLFVLLYGTSPVWAFQFYFSLQSAPVGFGIMLAAACAGADARTHTGKRIRTPVLALWELAGLACTCFLTVIYQSLIIYYMAAALTLFICRAVHGAECRTSRILLWAARIVLSLAVYAVVTRYAPGGQSRYLASQIRWGSQPLTVCLSNIAVEFGKTLFMIHSSHFSLYLPGIVLLGVFLARRKRQGQDKQWKWLLPAGIGLVLLPMAMSVFQGSRPVPRTQFALQIAAAFPVVLYAAESGGRHRALRVLCIAAVIVQAALVVRLGYTDDRRNREDADAAARITEDLREQGLDGRPLVFIGTLPFRDDSLLTEKTDVFGLSLFEWSYDPEKPFSATSGAVRLLSAATGGEYKGGNYKNNPAVITETAGTMPCYPEEGYIRAAEEYVLVKLSEAE